MSEPTPVFIDYADVRANLSEGATIGGVRYRSRPPDKGCLHLKGRIRYSSEHNGMVQACCTKCGQEWAEIRVVEAELSERAMQHIADQLAQLSDRKAAVDGE